MEEKDNKIFKKISIILIIICICIVTFFTSYYIFTSTSLNPYYKNLKVSVSSINNINTNISMFYSKNKFNCENTSKEIWTQIQNLNKIKENLDKIKSSYQNKQTYQKLYKGVNANLCTFNSLIILLNDPTNKNVSSTINNIQSSYKNCKQAYADFNLGNLKIKPSKNVDNLIDNCINYSYKQVEAIRDKEITQSQLIEFSTKIDSIFKKYCGIQKNYLNTLNDYDDAENKYDKLTKVINTDLSSLKNIDKQLYNLSIPQNQINLYNLLNTLISDYKDYANNFKYTLSVLKTQTEKNTVNSDSIYSTSNSKLANVQIDYDNFNNAYTQFKLSLYQKNLDTK